MVVVENESHHYKERSKVFEIEMFKVCIAVFLVAHFSSFDKDTKNCVIACTIYVNEKDCFTMSWGRLRMLLSTRKQVTYALNAILTALYLASDKRKKLSSI